MLRRLTRKVRGWLCRPAPPRPADNPSTPASPVPDATTRLYRAGVQSLREGSASEALRSLDEAISLSPAFAEAHNQAGLALIALGRLEEAAARFHDAVEARHDYVTAISNRGMICLQLRRYEEAEDCFKLALSLDAGSAEACFNLGMSCWKRGALEKARQHFSRAIELDAGFAGAHLNLGMVHAAQDDHRAALKCYDQAVALGPGLPEVHHNRGIALQRLGRTEDAVSDYRRALALKPDFAEGYHSLGNACMELDRLDEAAECYQRALAIKPDFIDAYNNLGSVFRVRGEFDRALGIYARALAIRPDEPRIHGNIGFALCYKGEIRGAIAAYESVLRLNSEDPEARLNLAIARLAVGDFARGWDDYEWRFRQPNPANNIARRGFPHAEWKGEPLAGKRLLISGEQGIGDEILFASLYQEMIERAAHCSIECIGKLVPLFRRSFPGARVFARTIPPDAVTHEAFDYQVAAGSLGARLRPSIDSFPARAGYLRADPARVASWKRRIAALDAGFRVGFSWRSSNLKGERALACTRLEQWAPIFGVPGVCFVCLQYGDCGAELAVARDRFGVPLHAFDEVDLFNDLDEASALTCALDLVISAPTSVSMLSAALGVPTWQMSSGPDWQVHGTDRNLWFPAMTQFRRDWTQDWDEVIPVVAGRLRTEARCVVAPGTTAT